MSHKHSGGLPYCQNCHYPLAEMDKFCPNCGQKNTDGHVSMHDLWHELMHYFTHVDNQIFVTIRHVFIPGKLTEEFFKGHRKRYIHPINLFFVVGFILPFILSQAWKNNLGGDKEISKGFISDKAIYRNDLLFEMDSVTKKDSNHYTGNLKIEFDTFISGFYQRSNDFKRKSLVEGQKKKGIIQRDSLYSWIDKSGKTLKIDELDINELSEEELFKKYHIDGYQDKFRLKQLVQTSKYGLKPIINSFTTKFIWITILSIVPTAAIFMLLYRRQKRLFVEHIIFLMHYSCFLFIIYSVFLFNKFWLIGLSMIFSYIFLVLAIKRFYQQSWLWTILKSTICFFVYLIIGMFWSGLGLIVSSVF